MKKILYFLLGVGLPALARSLSRLGLKDMPGQNVGNLTIDLQAVKTAKNNHLLI